jgi:Ca2+-binding EF-hand superfamily protein
MQEFAGQPKSSAAAAAVAELDRSIPFFDFGQKLSSPVSADDIEAIFYQYDRDSGGDIDKDELADALFRVGCRIPKARFEEMFLEFDEDSGGTIDLEEFKASIRGTEYFPDKSVKFAMDLFKKYDEDGGGTIDKFEFVQLAAEVETNYKRRTLLTGAAATMSGIVVARYSEEYQLAQKTFRSLYIEQKAEEAQKR